ncbi:DMT family transporter [Neomicrococcus aestuarii]|uniref:EamA-like transporter family protein n=1 Tax=Neomicrococcus aestuarii TaxID=556325 RepID=A0A1L2ZMR5_9MICC|nr:DMT family transporter [Neomicrococcus aestuarii]APF40406.1 hypothetical protein BHE16_04560 [Neomicrococcus aestuarii]
MSKSLEETTGAASPRAQQSPSYTPSPALPLAFAAFAGALMPVQGLIVGRAGTHMGSVLWAAVVSLGTAFVLLLVTSLFTAKGRQAWARGVTIWKERTIPRYFLLAGVIGACYLMIMAAALDTIGLAIFAVCIVAMRTISSMVIDIKGFSPAGKQPLTRQRALSAALLLVGAIVASSGAGARAENSPMTWVVLVLSAIIGALLSVQQSMNGHAGKAYKSTTTVTAINNLVAVVTLLIIGVILAILHVPAAFAQQPPEWWHFLAGPLGILFVTTGITLVPILGSLLTGIGLVTGQLVGSLLLDYLVAPEHVQVTEVLGVAITVLAIIVASLPTQRFIKRR